MYTYAQKIRLPHSFPPEICIYKHEHEKPNKGSERERVAGGTAGRGGHGKKTRKHMKKPQCLFRPPSGNSERAALRHLIAMFYAMTLRLGKCYDSGWRRLVKVYARRRRRKSQWKRKRSATQQVESIKKLEAHRTCN